jgi:hypothetical protein
MTPESIYSPDTLELLKDRAPRRTSKFILFEELKPVFDESLNKSFKSIIDNLISELGSKNNVTNNKIFRFNVEQVILNFISAMSSVSYIGIFGGKGKYLQDSELNQNSGRLHRFSHLYIHQVLDYLINKDLLIKENGFMERNEFDGFESCSHKTGMNKYYPTDKLLNDLNPFLFLTTTSFDINATKLAYIKIKELDDNGDKVGTKINYGRSEQLKNDRIKLQQINKFLYKQSFALKAPLKRAYSENIERGGRIYTTIQNVPSNSLPIRRTLRLNGSPLKEVDFKANHLAMSIVIFEKDLCDSLPIDPYQSLLEAAGYEDKMLSVLRPYAKAFVTRSLGASSLRKAQGAFRQWIEQRTQDYSISALQEIPPNHLFKKLKLAFSNLYPNIALFSDLGARLQKLEGDIMLEILLEGVERNIPIIPLHDASLCEERHVEEVKGMMKRHWSNVLETEHQPFVEVKS